MLMAMTVGAQTAPTPIGVGSAGLGPLTFDTMPNLADGWSTRSFGASGATITTVAGMDAAVQTLSASMINTNLGSSGTQPPSTSILGFRWHTVNHNIQSRPTGDDYLVMLVTLRNDTGADKGGVVVSYDFAVQSPLAGEIPGFRTFYSLSGAPNSWVQIPSLSDSETDGNNAAELTFTSAWETGANLYILWAYDNANGITDPSYTIDNFSVQFPNQPVAIVTQPHSATVDTCGATNLTVVVTGSLPQYQWFHGNTPITGANSATYNIPSAALSDAGSYHVHVSNSVNALDSAVVSVTVQQDSTPPTVASALARVDGTNIVITFNEKMDPNSLNDVTAYHLSPAGGGGDVQPSAAVASADAHSVTIRFDVPRTPNANYELVLDPNISDCSGNSLGNGEQTTVPLKYEVHLISFENSAWKYNHEGLDLGVDWRADLGYDDSTWSNGISVFDGKSTPRTTVGGMAVATQLPLHFGTYVADDVPVYYFRSHFTIGSPADVSALTLRTFVDDFDVAWMNGYDAPVHKNAGNPLTDLDSYGYSGGTAVGDAGILPTSGSFPINVTNLVAGDNVIAVKLFQQAVASSDITFAYELDAVVNGFAATGPALTVSLDGGFVTVTWANSADQLYEAPTVEGPWTLVGSGGTYSVAAGSTPTARFYTLRR